MKKDRKQTERHIYIQVERHSDGDGQKGGLGAGMEERLEMKTKTGRQADRHAGGKTPRQTERRAWDRQGRQTGKEDRNRQTGRRTSIRTSVVCR